MIIVAVSQEIITTLTDNICNSFCKKKLILKFCYGYIKFNTRRNNFCDHNCIMSLTKNNEPNLVTGK